MAPRGMHPAMHPPWDAAITWLRVRRGWARGHTSPPAPNSFRDASSSSMWMFVERMIRCHCSLVLQACLVSHPPPSHPCDSCDAPRTVVLSPLTIVPSQRHSPIQLQHSWSGTWEGAGGGCHEHRASLSLRTLICFACMRATFTPAHVPLSVT